MGDQQVLEQNLTHQTRQIVLRQLKALLLLVEHLVRTPGCTTKSHSTYQSTDKGSSPQSQPTGHQVCTQPRGGTCCQCAPQAGRLCIHGFADLQLAAQLLLNLAGRLPVELMNFQQALRRRHIRLTQGAHQPLDCSLRLGIQTVFASS